MRISLHIQETVTLRHNSHSLAIASSVAVRIFFDQSRVSPLQFIVQHCGSMSVDGSILAPEGVEIG